LFTEKPRKVRPARSDFNVAATKYFHGIEKGELPQASCSAARFCGPDGATRSRPSPGVGKRDIAARRSLASLMDTYYPNSAWQAARDIFERLYQYKTRPEF
jgi:hypothetical protein